MHRLLYVSRPTIAVTPAAMAHVALARNSVAGVTGFLFHDRRLFVQVLEGLNDDLAPIYASIRRDPRHEAVRTLLFEPVERRFFGAWAMGFHDGEADGGLIDRALGRRLRPAPGDDTAPELLRFLRRLALDRDRLNCPGRAPGAVSGPTPASAD